MTYKENPEKPQDRFEDTFDHFNRFGFVLFPQNKKIYQNLHKLRFQMWDYSILEAGCGQGTGTAILRQADCDIIGTDKLERNVKFAKELYSWIDFEVWDIAESPFREKKDIVICIEAIEHIKNYRQAIKNLIASAKKEVWISTPNRILEENQPSNPFHVKEFTIEEMLEMIGDYKVKIFHWDTFKELPLPTKVDPLVYRITL